MNGNSVALDTNQAIAILNGFADARNWLVQFDTIFLPIVVIAELRFGALKSRNSTPNLQRVDKLIGQCEVLGVRLETTIAYAELRLALRSIGKPIPENDVWIASICLDHGIPLATADAHFSVVPGLALVRR